MRRCRVSAVCEGMYREGKEGELNKESTCVNVGEINKQRNVLPYKTHDCRTKHMRLPNLTSHSHPNGLSLH